MKCRSITLKPSIKEVHDHVDGRLVGEIHKVDKKGDVCMNNAKIHSIKKQLKRGRGIVSSD